MIALGIDEGEDERPCNLPRAVFPVEWANTDLCLVLPSDWHSIWVAEGHELLGEN